MILLLTVMHLLQSSPEVHKQIQELCQDVMAQVRMPEIHLTTFSTQQVFPHAWELSIPYWS
jgi:hypothetical protein